MKKIIAFVVVAGLGSALVATEVESGCGAKCCRRAESTPTALCRRRDPNTLKPSDWGSASMPATHAVGVGCEPAECVAGGGIEWLDGGIVPSEWL